MPNYYPILKAKQGELTALQADIAPDYVPVVEIVPWERDSSSEFDASEASETAEITKLTARLLRAWNGKTGPILLDAAAAEPDPESGWASTDTTPLLARVLQDLRPRVDALPVFRLSTDRTYVTRAGEAARAAMVESAAIRVTAEDLDDTVSPLRESVSRVAEDAGFSHDQVDVIVDFGAVDESKTAMAARLARFILPQLDGEGWRSLVLASGAFPVNLSEVSPATLGQIERYDYRLWQTLSAMKLRIPLHFADYAVGHPELQTGAAFAAPPQLRYTLDDRWLVGKGRRNDRRGHAQFFDICRAILDRAGDHARPATDSWGDHRVHEAAEVARTGEATIGPGNASTWRSIATSHHLALVPRQLSGSVVP